MSVNSKRKLLIFGFAPPGGGKTEIFKNLGSKSDDQLRPTTDPSKEMQVQIGRSVDHQPTLPTDPTGDKPLDDLTGKEVMWSERVGIGNVPAWDLGQVAPAGEEVTRLIRSGQYQNYADLGKWFDHSERETRVLVAVQNACLSFPVRDPNKREPGTPVAHRPLQALVAYLCRLYDMDSTGAAADVPAPAVGTASLLRTAIETATQCFGLAAPEPVSEQPSVRKKRRKKDGESPDEPPAERTDVHAVHPAIGSCFQHLPADAYLDYSYGPHGGRFEVVSNDLTAEQKQAILENLGRVSDTLAHRYREQFEQHKRVAEHARLVVVARTWVDLMNLLAEEGFLEQGPIEDANKRALGRLADKPKVDADHYSVSFASDWRAVAAGRQKAFWPNPDEMATKRAKGFDQLLAQLDHIMLFAPAPTQPPSTPVRPAATSQDGRRGDVFLEGLYITAQAAAVTFAVVTGLTVLLGWHSEVFGRWLLAAAAVSVARGVWHFTGTGRPANPAWKIADGRITVLDASGTPVHVPDASAVRSTPLAGLFDCGFVPANGRLLLVPQFQRFATEAGATVRTTPFAVVVSLAGFACLLMPFVVAALLARA